MLRLLAVFVLAVKSKLVCFVKLLSLIYHCMSSLDVVKGILYRIGGSMETERLINSVRIFIYWFLTILLYI